MAATITSYPPGYAAAYRPMMLKARRTDPAGSAITAIRVADANDVATHAGSGLQVGQVFVQHATIQGSIPLVIGQTLHIYQNGGKYEGVWRCLNTWGSGTVYTVIDAPNFGNFTPSGSPTSALRVWLEGYSILAKLLIYTAPGGTPVEEIVRAHPHDAQGNVTADLSVVLRDYFDRARDQFIRPMPGTPVQTAHGSTAIFYRLHIVEVWDGPAAGSADPFDGSHDIVVDDTNDPDTFRVAVNAVHPYAGIIVDWNSSDLSDFRLGDPLGKFLTLAPRGTVQGSFTSPGGGLKLTANADQWMWLFLLTDKADGWGVRADLKLKITDLTTGTPVSGPSVALSLAGEHAAVAIGFGPANLGNLVAGMARYSVYINDEGDPNGAARASELAEVEIVKGCEGHRHFAWLNKLGGVDAAPFNGREIYSSAAQRATVRKPYNDGTAFDWRERTYRVEPKRTRTVSTKPVNPTVQRWLSEDMGESPDVMTMEHGRAAPVVMLSGAMPGGDTSGRMKPVTVDYRLGVDDISQQG